MKWIRSDPRGYIKIATLVDEKNEDFRKAVKIAKKWKHSCANLDEGFKLKSFHIEQIVTAKFQEEPNLDVFGAVFSFFTGMSDVLISHIPDRADPTQNIDSYVDELTPTERRLVVEARDHVLTRLEDLNSDSDLQEIFGGGFYGRKCKEEKYLFDQSIPVLTDPTVSLRIDGRLRLKPGFRVYWLSEKNGHVVRDREIDFQIRQNTTNADLLKWKVKNDDNCDERRGEITDNQTCRVPEVTKYPGHHYVECFAVRDSVCVARSRQNVIIGS
jgi:hypothetical protein